MQMLRTQSPPTTPSPGHFDQPRCSRRKRKADVVQDGERERLSKRLSQLRIEHSRQCHAPVEAAPSSSDTSSRPHRHHHHSSPRNGDESMQLDDSKHKVYIHNIDDELSSSDSECEAGRVVFLPHVEKHLRQSRIPRHILANEEGELAGMQLVLYRDPTSLSVPEERDGVRKAVLESRQRIRERQRQETTQSVAPIDVGADGDDDAMELD